MIGILLGFLVAHQSRRCGTVVTVGDVEAGNMGKDFGDAAYRLVVVDDPEVMAESIGSDKVVLGCTRRLAFDDGVELVVVGVGEEYRLDVGVVDAHVFHAVFLLVATGNLVFLDDARHVVVDISPHDQSVLGVTVHRLGIDVVVLFVVLYQPPFLLEHVEVVYCLVVHFGTVFVGTGSKIDFGLDDVVERFLISLGLLSSLFGIQHIVRTRSHLFDKFFRRT